VLATVQRRLKSLPQEPPQQFEGAGIRYHSGRFAIVGDLQRTSRIEFWRKPNTDEGLQLIQQIATEAPDFLAIVGDLVFCGSSAADWAAFDQLATPLSQASVPVLPILGNHDYWITPRVALGHFFARFPHLEGGTGFPPPMAPWG
jgi:hypothetical protein